MRKQMMAAVLTAVGFLSASQVNAQQRFIPSLPRAAYGAGTALDENMTLPANNHTQNLPSWMFDSNGIFNPNAASVALSPTLPPAPFGVFPLGNSVTPYGTLTNPSAYYPGTNSYSVPVYGSPYRRVDEVFVNQPGQVFDYNPVTRLGFVR